MAVEAPKPAERREIARILKQALRVEARSLYAYLVANSEPLEDRALEPVKAALRKVRGDLAEHVNTLATLVDDYGATPDPGSYPFFPTFFNFLEPEYVFGKMEAAIPDDVAKLGELAKQCGARPDLQTMLRRFAHEKNEHKSVLAGARKPAVPAKPAAGAAAPKPAPAPAAVKPPAPAPPATKPPGPS
ncbi:MAG: hypothetical protein L0216_03920 [Planctomycetales bacterium]|nr:hypothetical protein [Planctomycetales bacterium]